MSFKVFVVIIFLIIQLLSKGNRKCRALTLQGGALKGAYQVGALRAFIDYLHPIEYSYQAVAGV